MPLHKPRKSELSGESTSPSLQSDELESSRSQVIKILNESLAKLEEEKPVEDESGMRWELASCWVQHLRKENAEKNPKEAGNDKQSELPIKGLGREFKSLRKRDKRQSSVDSLDAQEEKETQVSGLESNEKVGKDGEASELEKLLSEEAFLRLKETETGLHLKTVDELITMIQSYYDDIALSKLVTDFASLELSPVDGRTLTDFMHLGGLRMHSLGRVFERSLRCFY